MNAREIRSSFLDAFARANHRIVPSSSLVPADDPTLLFTNAGMNQFKDVFLGRERRDYVRAATAQKCMRVSGKHNDLDNVGPSPRHHTFFEMLGNFSFGDYFKAGAVELAWHLLTDTWKLPPERLHATVFGGEAGIPRDEEGRREWRRFLPDERILDLGLADNFWQMGDTGPCGRCSEIYYFRGDGPPPARPHAEDERYMEVWNLVFMEFDRQPDGILRDLPAPSIDTGMGLERIAAVIQGVPSNYGTDLFQPILRAVSRRASLPYAGSTGDRGESDVSMRVIADHLRAMVFLIGDGVIPSNEWRGYVLRKIMRRAMRHGKKLGLTEPFLHDLVNVVVGEMASAYPDLRTGRDGIVRVVRAEEQRFDKVLTDGLPRLETIVNAATSEHRPVSGEEAFRLYDTYGLPWDFIEDTAQAMGAAIDRAAFERAMESQRERARASSAFDRGAGEGFAFESDQVARDLGAIGDRFEGYGETSVSGVPVVALFDESKQPCEALEEGERGWVLLARTPFYLEAGGQVSDTGRLLNEATGADAAVEGLARVGPALPRAHQVRVTRGRVALRDLLTATVDAERRDATRRHHSATHLLHAALREVLGPHVKQAGSLVAPDRLRFDFVHFQALNRDEIDRVEERVNRDIRANHPVATEVKATEEAIAAGAMALFGEKYGDRVRVVRMGPSSLELCGGTHVSATGEIGFFLITEEGGVAAGVRRVEALAGDAAVRHAQVTRRSLGQLVGALNTTPRDAADVVQRLQSEVKRLSREVQTLRIRAASGPADASTADTFDIEGIKVVTRKVDDLDRGALRGLADAVRDSIGSGVVVVASVNDGKVSFVVSVTKDLTSRVKAGEIVKAIGPIVGGGGGGRPDFAEAGGKDPSKVDDMLIESRAVVRRMLSG
jgi:alanyl-tRNA synthetase